MQHYVSHSTTRQRAATRAAYGTATRRLCYGTLYTCLAILCGATLLVVGLATYFVATNAINFALH